MSRIMKSQLDIGDPFLTSNIKRGSRSSSLFSSSSIASNKAQKSVESLTESVQRTLVIDDHEVPVFKYDDEIQEYQKRIQRVFEQGMPVDPNRVDRIVGEVLLKGRNRRGRNRNSASQSLSSSDDQSTNNYRVSAPYAGREPTLDPASFYLSIHKNASLRYDKPGSILLKDLTKDHMSYRKREHISEIDLSELTTRATESPFYEDGEISMILDGCSTIHSTIRDSVDEGCRKENMAKDEDQWLYMDKNQHPLFSNCVYCNDQRSKVKYWKEWANRTEQYSRHFQEQYPDVSESAAARLSVARAAFEIEEEKLRYLKLRESKIWDEFMAGNQISSPNNTDKRPRRSERENLSEKITINHIEPLNIKDFSVTEIYEENIGDIKKAESKRTWKSFKWLHIKSN
ncbi:hypothetical protein V1511DRAFT_489608 [Dipodascopsis uninucleata]